MMSSQPLLEITAGLFMNFLLLGFFFSQCCILEYLSIFLLFICMWMLDIFHHFLLLCMTRGV